MTIPAVALAVPAAMIVYPLLGGGLIGGVACIAIGLAARWAVETLLVRSVEVYRWWRDRDKPVEPASLSVPSSVVYLVDWTKDERDGRI